MDAGFNERWGRHPAPQATTAGILWQKTGWAPADLAGKTVLDAGCGCGRLTQVAVEAGAEHVVGIDSSPNAIAAARVNAPAAEFFRADLLSDDLDVGWSRPFDRVFSVGVLHHTASPLLAFQNIARLVAPGGELAVWLYGMNASDVAPVMEFLHDLTRALPPAVLHSIIAAHAPKLRDHYARAWGPLQQVVRVSNSTDDEECISDTFDWHTPQYRSGHTEQEVVQWFVAEGFDVVWCGPFTVSVRGVKR